MRLMIDYPYGSMQEIKESKIELSRLAGNRRVIPTPSVLLGVNSAEESLSAGAHHMRGIPRQGFGMT
ncbi:hypothetical protein A3J43_00070 [Candidatus Uhrbacteria bacterium RIFCSPHIGHO2_12_FULL_54_23]|uniref:Uncharacterized protein n=1 Tax=Candidatus Uhrbacteria bacterium RIFCSPHIGHO2_12_FULL_54_23 TaxID=1802397 RepID=A0A1F7UFV7_9BACT|nr:MAG: hypothetical protein A3J43_00070 [Candidatus Uhrbacteria bacterium RIFCSPHIGHO2_12_FULL_54_23]